MFLISAEVCARGEKTASPNPVQYDLGLGCDNSWPRAAHTPPNHDRQFPAADPAFVENRGQWNGRVRYTLLGARHRVWIEPQAVALLEPAGGDDRLVRMIFEGANRESLPAGSDALGTRYSFFLGRDPASWRRGVSGYRAVVWRDLYPGVDVWVRTKEGRVEYDVVAASATCLSMLQLRFEGIDSSKVLENGEARLWVGSRALVQSPPHGYSCAGSGEKVPVPCLLVDLGHGRFRLEPAMPDHRQQLVVDPGLEWATFLGGAVQAVPSAGADGTGGIAVALDGTVIVSGRTGQSDFPITAGSALQAYGGGGSDGFVSRFSPDGAALLWSTYLGGSSFDAATGVAVAGSGDVVVAGMTTSNDYPITFGAYQTSIKNAPFLEGFVTKLTAAGDAVIASTFVGGSSDENLLAVAVDAVGSPIVGGQSLSVDYPVTPGAFDLVTIQGLSEAFVTTFLPDLSGLRYSTYLGGSKTERVLDLAVDGHGAVTAVGQTDSLDFPTVAGSFSTTLAAAGQKDAFVTRFDASGSAVFSTYLGGLGSDEATGVALDALGQPTVTGMTVTSQFPTTPGVWENTCVGGGFCNDAFISRFRLDGTALIWSTYAGGIGIHVAGIAVDSLGGPIIVGANYNFSVPLTAGAFDTTLDDSELWIVRYDPKVTQPVYGTLLGASAFDDVPFTTDPVAVTEDDSIVIAGVTQSQDFPVTAGAFATQLKGLSDVFVAKLDLLSTGVTKYGTATPGCAGTPAIGMYGVPEAGGEAVLTCGRVPQNSVVWLVAGSAGLASPVPLSGASLWVDAGQPFTLAPILTGKCGSLFLPLRTHGTGVPPGSVGYLQLVFADACAPGGVAASKALEVVVQP